MNNKKSSNPLVLQIHKLFNKDLALKYEFLATQLEAVVVTEHEAGLFAEWHGFTKLLDHPCRYYQRAP